MFRTLVLEITGAAAVVYGFAQIDAAAGWIVGGGLALVAAWRSSQS